MKKLLVPIIAFLLSFAIGAAGGSALAPAPAAADSTLVDSTANDSTPNDSSRVAADSGVIEVSDSTAAPVITPRIDTATPPSARSVADRGRESTLESLVRTRTGATVNLQADGSVVHPAADTLPDYARLARLLGKMGPREAARTIEQLPQAEAARALAAMPDRQAALVLAQLAPTRAAALLQATLALEAKGATP